jgi:hypothetical protein
MSSFKLFFGLAGCVLAVAGLPGCYVSTEPLPGPGGTPVPAVQTGTVTVSWTVAGSHSPPACSQFGADSLELVITDRANRPVTTVSAPCTDFSLQVPLPPGNYEALATLIDTQSSAMSTSLPLHDIAIVPASDLTIDIDFPSTSKL